MRSRAVQIAEIGVVAAAYAALTYLLAPLSYGPLQFRVAECIKPLVIWEPHLIPAFVIGNFLGNVRSQFVGPWELAWMPFANLVGAWACWRAGRVNAYLGAAAYALIIAAAVSTMLSVILRARLTILLPPIAASELILLLGGVPLMRSVHSALSRLYGERGRGAESS